MTNENGELVTSIPSKCKDYEPIKSKPKGVKCAKIGILYECKNHKGERPGCLFCERFVPDTDKNNAQLPQSSVVTDAYGKFTLKSMTDFVFMLRNRTTSELVRDFPKNFKTPVYTGKQSEIVKDMLAIDAIQWRLTGEYAKFCRTQLNKNQFDQNDKDNCLFKGNWKHKRCGLTKVDNVYNDDFNINIDTLNCFQYVEGGCLDFKLVGNTIGQMAESINDLELTDLAIKRIFGFHEF